MSQIFDPCFVRGDALHLAKRIKRYWRVNGYAPHVEVKLECLNAEPLWVIRSNMVNGHPRAEDRL